MGTHGEITPNPQTHNFFYVNVDCFSECNYYINQYITLNF